MFARHGRMALAISATALLAGCAGSIKPHVPVPDEPGLYGLMPDDELQRLDGSKDWEVSTWRQRSDFGPDQQFVISDPILVNRGTSDVAIELWQVSWIRSDIRSDGSAAPVRGSQWTVAPLEPFRVPLSFRSVAENPDVLHIVPQEALEPGLYSLQLRQGDATRTARIGVEWSSVDQDDYSADHCVDRKVSVPTTYQTCNATETAATSAQTAGQTPGQTAGTPSSMSKDLKIKLAKPVTTTVAGQRILIVEGVVTNVAASTRAVPMLEAALRDRSGNVLGRWSFAASPNLLSPGQTASFRTEIQQPPSGTTRVNVNFQSNASAQQ